MADLIREFDLILENNPESFGNWLVLESIELFQRQPLKWDGFGDKDDLLFVVSPRLVPPTKDWPCYTFELDGFVFYPRETNREIDAFQLPLGVVVSIDIRKLDANRIQVIGRWSGSPKPLDRLKVQIDRVFVLKQANGDKNFKQVGRTAASSESKTSYRQGLESLKSPSEPRIILVDEGVGELPPIIAPTDQRIWDWIRDDPDLTDTQIGQRLGISRQAANSRRNKLKAMGYKVR